LESTLISARVTAGMSAARARGRRLGRPPAPPTLVCEIETLARATELNVRAIHRRIDGRASHSRVGEITKRVRST
ncbi:MAG: resolvase, partial [Geminicoccaceae bacterium]